MRAGGANESLAERLDSPPVSALFSHRPTFVGVVHLAATPGSPRFAGSIERVVERAIDDARALQRGGCDALIVENFGDAPFFPRGVPPETIASVAVCVRAVKSAAGGIPIGVNVLRNDARAALGIAAATGAAFIRVNVHAGAAITDQGIVEGRAFETARERERLARGVLLLCDVDVKHAQPLARQSLAHAVSDLVRRALADAVIVTGRATGEPPSAASLEEARSASGGAPVLVGSGLSEVNARDLLSAADGAIVGTSLKHGGEVENPVDPARVAALARIFAALHARR